jgi:hypothetical protein
MLFGAESRQRAARVGSCPQRGRISDRLLPMTARAIRAGPRDLHGVGDIDEAVRLSRLCGPALYLRAFHLDCKPAVPADQMVVMAIAIAPAIASFAVVAAQGVELPGVGERTDLVVDRRQCDVLALGEQLGVEFLRGTESMTGV